MNITLLEPLFPPLFVANFERDISGFEKPLGKELDMKKSRYTDRLPSL